MKKILFLLFTLVSLNSFAQLYQTMPQYGYTMQRADIQQVLKVPSDTTTNKTGIVRRGTVLYVGNGTYWTPAGSVLDTTSISNRINLKLNISDTSGMRAQLIAGSGIGLSGTYPNITVANTGLLTTPTWQETLTAGGNTVTTDNNNDLAGYDFTLVNGNYVALGGNEVFITDAKSSIHLYNNDLTLKPYTGNLKVDTLTNAPGTKAMRYNPSTGLVSYYDTTAGNAGTVTSITATAPLTGGTITSSGSIGADTSTANTGLATKYQVGLKADLLITTNRQTSNYTLALTDVNKLVETNIASANTLTVPLNSTIAFSIGTKIDVAQYGAGQTTITPATAGVTIRSFGGALKIAGQYSACTLVKISTDEWYCFGNLTN